MASGVCDAAAWSRRPRSPRTGARWAARRRTRSPPYSASCRWSCSARTARPARSGCWPWCEDLVTCSPLPVSAQPNAGQPRRVGRPPDFEFSVDGSYFARYLRRFAEAGAALVGGCCGTTPTHIEAAVAQLAGAAAPAPARGRGAPRPALAAARPTAGAGTGPGWPGRPAGPRRLRDRRRDRGAGRRRRQPDHGHRAGAAAEQGVDLVAVTAPEHPRAHRDASRPGAAPAAARRGRGHGDDDDLGQDHHDPAGRPARRARARHPRRHLRGRRARRCSATTRRWTASGRSTRPAW